MEDTLEKEKKSRGRGRSSTQSASARKRAEELTASERLIETLKANNRPTFEQTVTENKKHGKRPVQLSPTLIVFSDKTKEELLERYKNTNNIFS